MVGREKCQEMPCKDQGDWGSRGDWMSLDQRKYVGSLLASYWLNVITAETHG